MTMFIRYLTRLQLSLRMVLGVQLVIVGLYIYLVVSHEWTGFIPVKMVPTGADTLLRLEFNISKMNMSGNNSSDITVIQTDNIRSVQKQEIPRKWPFPNITSHIPPEIEMLAPATSCSSCPVKELNGVLCLNDSANIYLKQILNETCLIEGTNWTLTTHNSSTCTCKKNWHGLHCSIPDAVYHSSLPRKFLHSLKLRKIPRRIISGFPFNMEFEMIETRFAEMGDLVDAFIIQESNYTAYGDPKPLRLLRYLQGKHNLTKSILCKIVYVFLDFFPSEAYYDGWIIDSLQKRFVGSQGIYNQLKYFRHDDIVILSDADELQAKETILFLKIHDGYPESFGYNYRWHIYGYFWLQKELLTSLNAGMTMGMLTHVVGLKHFDHLRSFNKVQQLHGTELNTYMKAGGLVSNWRFGSAEYPAGWHCSWCLSPEGIRDKLISAQNGDFPRWGDYTEKLNLTYISSLIKHGKWFNGNGKFIAVNRNDPMYAPSHVLYHPINYKHLLLNQFV